MESSLNLHFENEKIHNKLNMFLTTKKIPHIIFHGSSGTGKKTILYDFLKKIYNGDKSLLKSNVLIANCSHGKGIKFIREDVKNFAKTNLQMNKGVIFKSIVLMNADSLTIDAQSALRRCIELFSYNTRFFIVVENKHKLLNPILSRFCEIYVPDVLLVVEKGCKIREDVKTPIDDLLMCSFSSEECKDNTINKKIHDISNDFYEKAISCIDVVNYIKECDLINDETKIKMEMLFQQVKMEFKNEKMLMYYILFCLLQHIKHPHLDINTWIDV